MTSKEPAPPHLQAAFEEIQTLPHCQVSICAQSLEGPLKGTQFGVGEDRVYPSASLIKILVLVELLRQVDNGDTSLDEEIRIARVDLIEDSALLEGEELPGSFSLRRLAEGMIQFSDNTATNCLISHCGMDRIDTHARELNLQDTTLHRRMMDFDARARGEDNFTTASDMVALLVGLWESRSLSAHSRAFAIDTLLGQKLTSRIPITPPPGARFAHKTGELEGIEHDAGIMLLPGRSFAVAILARGEIGNATAAIESTTLSLYKAM